MELLIFIQVYTFFNNNTPHCEQHWTVLIRQLLHTYQWQHASQWATQNCFNQTIVHCANSCKQSIEKAIEEIDKTIILSYLFLAIGMKYTSHFPANTSTWPIVGSMLVQRLRRWPNIDARRWTNIDPAMGEWLVFAWLWTSTAAYSWSSQKEWKGNTSYLCTKFNVVLMPLEMNN